MARAIGCKMERHVTIGITGHVDHGKTTLVRALTGIDTDRMKEEKIRGLSIEFGIAPMTLPSGVTISLVDVPGHTDFMKNTIRGLSAVDSAILVVSANDGVMPQTREHFEILRFLGIETGFIVLSKADLVDRETLELATLEVYDFVSGSFLEKSPVIPFYGINMRGRDEIIAAIETLVSTTRRRKDSHRPFRLFIDQIRNFQGLGAVVSGTILSGRLHRGDQLEILPSGQMARARSLETHHSEIEAAIAGARVGINLQGISLKDISRGMVLAEPGSIRAVRYLNVEFFLSGRGRQSVKTGQRVKTYLGTTLIGAFLVIIGGDEICPGDTGFAQLRLMDRIGAVAGDPFVVTPMDSTSVIGGGKVLETTPIKYRRAWAPRVLPLLKALQSREIRQIVRAVITAYPEKLITAKELNHSTGIEWEQFEKVLKNEASEGFLLRIDDQKYISAHIFRNIKSEILLLVERILQENTVMNRVSMASVKTLLPREIETCAMDLLLKDLIREGKLMAVNGGITIPSLFQERVSARGHVMEQVLSTVEGSGIIPVSVATVWRSHQDQEKEEVKKVLEQLLSQGKIVKLSNDRYLSCNGLEEIKNRVSKWVKSHGNIKVNECNEALGISRNVGILILEYLDSVGFTLRHGNERFLK
ncbi:MAG: selenocysteine-specific translation elongation factor [Proteobacteria bacterium]|nr:selenocysteine-specific translation elongation factor [Pseudomonadota bacterium]